MLVTRATAVSRSKRLEQLDETQHASASSRHHAARRAATAAAAKPTEAITESVRQLQGEEHQQQTEGQTAKETRLLWREVQPDGRAMASTSHDIRRQLKMLFLPEGYPASVSPDYLQYQLWALPTHVTVSRLPAVTRLCHACALRWELELRSCQMCGRRLQCACSVQKRCAALPLCHTVPTPLQASRGCAVWPFGPHPLTPVLPHVFPLTPVSQGWLSHSLTTSSLLQAVGLSVGPVGTTALTAAFKWIAKDGVGAAGRLLVGGRLGLELDDDPRRCGEVFM